MNLGIAWMVSLTPFHNFHFLLNCVGVFSVLLPAACILVHAWFAFESKIQISRRQFNMRWEVREVRSSVEILHEFVYAVVSAAWNVRMLLCDNDCGTIHLYEWHALYYVLFIIIYIILLYHMLYALSIMCCQWSIQKFWKGTKYKITAASSPGLYRKCT